MTTMVRDFDDRKSVIESKYVVIRRKANNLEAHVSTSSTSNTGQTITAQNDEIPVKTKWSLLRKVLLSLAIALIICVIVTAIVLAVLLTRHAATSISTSTSTTPTVPPTIISAYWSFDNVTTDSYGVYNGNLMNGASYSSLSTTQPYLGNGRALSLSSSSSQLFLVSTPFFNLSYTSFTIEGWIYSITSFTGDTGIFGQCQCSTCADQCLSFIVRGGRLYVSFTLNDISGSTVLTVNTWYHVAFVYSYERQQQILYVNGIQDSIRVNVDPYQGTKGAIEIGSTNVSLTTNYFNGYIDNIKITTRAKSAAEILSDASLIAYYSFDLPSPNIDNGPNGLNGISNNTVSVVGRVNQAFLFTGSSSFFQAYGFYQAGYGVYTNKPFSISMWINPLSTASSAFVQQSTSQSGGLCLNMIGFYSASGLNGQLAVQTYGFPTIFGPYIITNTWTHLSWTYSPTNGFTLYVNKVLFGSTGAYNLNAVGAITWLQIGYNFVCTAGFIPNGGYQGSIDEIYVHNRELTQSDVTTLGSP